MLKIGQWIKDMFNGRSKRHEPCLKNISDQPIIGCCIGNPAFYIMELLETLKNEPAYKKTDPSAQKSCGK